MLVRARGFHEGDSCLDVWILNTPRSASALAGGPLDRRRTRLGGQNQCGVDGADEDVGGMLNVCGLLHGDRIVGLLFCERGCARRRRVGGDVRCCAHPVEGVGLVVVW